MVWWILLAVYVLGMPLQARWLYRNENIRAEFRYSSLQDIAEFEGIELFQFLVVLFWEILAWPLVHALLLPWKAIRAILRRAAQRQLRKKNKLRK